jgi:hypothetical protein
VNLLIVRWVKIFIPTAQKASLITNVSVCPTLQETKYLELNRPKYINGLLKSNGKFMYHKLYN